ncbi:hypothetical protein Tco_1255881 [Tanacetum coccineum]
MGGGGGFDGGGARGGSFLRRVLSRGAVWGGRVVGCGGARSGGMKVLAGGGGGGGGCECGCGLRGAAVVEAERWGAHGPSSFGGNVEGDGNDGLNDVIGM